MTNLEEPTNVFPVEGFMMTRETFDQTGVFIVNASSVPSEKLAKSGAEKVEVKYLVDERHGSERFALRLYSVEKSGHTPMDRHVYEHQVYVLSGEGSLKQVNDGLPVLKSVRAGDTIFIPSFAVHQFINEREEPLVFLCVKGNPALYAIDGKSTASDDSAGNFC